MDWGNRVFRVVIYNEEQNRYFFRMFLPKEEALRLFCKEAYQLKPVWIEKIEGRVWRPCLEEVLPNRQERSVV